MKKVKLLFVLITMISTCTISAQVAINKDGSNPNSNSILHVKGDATNKNIVLEPGTNGNVGIGTTSPGQKLEVIGSAKIQNLYLTNSLMFSSNASLRLIGGGPQTTRSNIYLTNGGGIDINAANDQNILLNNGNVGIGTTNPESSAILDVNSDTMGMLIPRMTEAQRDAISSPATGLIIYQTNGVTGLYNYSGSVWTSVSRYTYSIGDFAQGGIVFWVDNTGEHGLVCAKLDQDGGGGVRWYAGTSGLTQAKGDGPFAGESNTSIIIAAQVAIGDDEGNYAARICNELQISEDGKTYGDWYLPSMQELILMYQNKGLINATAIANGGVSFIESSYYWSSTEYSNLYSYSKGFATGAQFSTFKSREFYVRAIRAF